MGLFEAHGFQATTFSEIARAARVSRGTVFNYFPYKEALLVAYFGEQLDLLGRSLAGGGAPADPLAELYELFEALARFLDGHRDLVLPLSYELLNPDPDRSRAAFLALPLSDMLKERLERARAAGRVRSDYSRERLARTLANTFFITSLEWAAYRQDRPIAEELRTALRLTLEGLEVSPRAAPADGGS